MTAPALNTSRSQAIFGAAQGLMPGGVSSPVRAFKSVGGQPIVFDRVKGPYAWDVDGNKYIDYIGSWGRAICGHAIRSDQRSAGSDRKGHQLRSPLRPGEHPGRDGDRRRPERGDGSLRQQRHRGLHGGAPPDARLHKRDKVIKFEGCYHGHADMFLVKADPVWPPLACPIPLACHAAPPPTPLRLLTTTWKQSSRCSPENPDAIAGVILEPIVGNAGFIQPEPGFLEGLRELTKEHGALLVFDEVMTGFRISYGGAQAHFGVTPDLTTMGKVIGGGLPRGCLRRPGRHHGDGGSSGADVPGRNSERQSIGDDRRHQDAGTAETTRQLREAHRHHRATDRGDQGGRHGCGPAVHRWQRQRHVRLLPL